MQEKIEFSCMLQRQRLISTKILGGLSLLGFNDKVTVKNSKKILRGGKRWHPVAQGGTCHSMPPHGYRPVGDVSTSDEEPLF